MEKLKFTVGLLDSSDQFNNGIPERRESLANVKPLMSRKRLTMQVDVPLIVILPRKTKADKRVLLNLNTYRNLHHRTNNVVKHEFKKIVERLVANKTLDINPPYQLTYTLYPQSKRTLDVSNICSVVDKFFCDAMTELGFWEDDNYHIIPEVKYRFGEVDKENPRVSITIRPFVQ